MKWMIRILGMALLIASVPGAASLGLYDRSGKLTVSYALVKSIIAMVMSSAFVDVILRRLDAQTES